MNQRHVFFALCAILVTINCFQFDLEARDFKCFRDELVTNFDVYGEYEVQPGYSQIIDFRITDFKGNVLLDRRNIRKGDFSLVAKEGGEYSFCFYNRLTPGATYYPGLKRRITFDVLSGTDTFDYEQLARKEHLKPVEVNLRMMEDIVKSIHAEYVYFRHRESDMRQTNESTNARISWLGTLSTLVMIAFALGQVFYLKNYFIKKKLI